jgi:dihydroorotate dehydrogenase (NAD+) catalytic subunit
MDYPVELAPNRKGGLTLRNPVLTASGTFGYGIEFLGLLDIERLGAIVTKGVSWRPRSGNPPPRLIESPAGLLNSVGLQNPGVRSVVRNKAPIWARWHVPVIVNVFGETIDEYARVAELLSRTSGVAALEVNVSSPNAERGGLHLGLDAESAAAVTGVVRSVTDLPLIVKISHGVPDPLAVAKSVEAAGADALTCGNTLVGMAIDWRRRRPSFALGRAGLSGPAIKPMALHWVHRIAQVVSIAVIGCGGISSAQDAFEFLLAGASAVQVGTATFMDPLATVKIADGLAAMLEEAGVGDLGEIIGAALPKRIDKGQGGI